MTPQNTEQARARVAPIRRWVSLLPYALLVLGMANAGAADLRRYSDFGQADIFLTAASITQSGDTQTALIDQKTDIAGTDRALFPIGNGNIADVSQDGGYDETYARQTGNLNRIRIQQDGFYNYVEATQNGVGNSLDVVQTGAENRLTSNQDGFGNTVYLRQAGGNLATFNEVGDNNSISVTQVVGGPALNINLVGSGLKVNIVQ